MPHPLRLAFVLTCMKLLGACGETAPETINVLNASEPINAASADATPLLFIGDGYPSNGSPCRRVGESAATVDFLDDSADLVGCPSAKDAKDLGGKVVATIGGTTLISVSRKAPPMSPSKDALIAGTDYNATAEIECVGYRGAPAGRCPAGVKRNRDDGVTTVEVTWPDGGSRAIFFKNGKVLSADTNQADGSARFEVKSERKDDITTVTIGPERYVIPDAFVTGG